MLLPVPALSPVGRRGAGAGNPLHQSLVAYWKLDETSGTRFDSTGRGNHLTDNNTVTSTAGKVGQAAFFTRANNEWLGHASNTDLLLGDVDFTIAGWFRPTNVILDAGIVSKWDSTIGVEWLIEVFNGDLYFLISNGTTVHSVQRPIAINTWYFFVASHDAAADQIALSVNQGTAATTSHSSGAQSTSQQFHVGQYASRFHNGEVDELGVWKRKLTAAEQTQLFNSGSGITLF